VIEIQKLKETLTVKGRSLFDLSNEKEVLVVFLRHLGCVFCQEAIQDLRRYIKDGRILSDEIVFVHMASGDVAMEYFDDFKLEVTHHVSDPECSLYESFGLVKATTRELFSFQVMLRTAENMVTKGNFPARKRIGDGFQMPGVFVLENGKIKSSYIHKRISDKPDYLSMMNR